VELEEVAEVVMFTIDVVEFSGDETEVVADEMAEELEDEDVIALVVRVLIGPTLGE
jgi:hypothetical protein